MGIGSLGSSYMNFVFGNGTEMTANYIKAAVKHRKTLGIGRGKAIAAGFRKGVKRSNASIATQGGFFKSSIKAFKDIPNSIKAAKGFGKIGATFKALGKTLPGLFAAMMLIGEIPNAVKATKDKGIGQGALELGKSAVKLGGGAAGCAIGQALIPIPLVGGLVGWIAGEWLTSKIVGKSYSEKVAEKEAKNNPVNENPAVELQNTKPTFTFNKNIPNIPQINLPDIDTDYYAMKYPYINFQNTTPQQGLKLNIVSQ